MSKLYRYNVRYSDRPSILAMKNKCTELNSTISFKKVGKEQISTAIKLLDSKKVSKSNDIPLRIIKEFSDISGGFLVKNFNECLDKGFFPEELKCAEIVPVYKKMIKYTSSNISKLYENCTQQQISEKFESLLSKFQCGFRQEFSTQLPFRDGRKIENN